MGVLLKLHKALRRSHQLTLHKAFLRPNLDYGGIIFDQYMTIWCTSCNNKSNRRHLVGVWGTRSEVLSAPSLVQKQFSFDKFYKCFFRSYPLRSSGYIAGGMQGNSLFKTKQEFFLGTLFFRSTTIELRNIDQKVRNSNISNIFRNNSIVKFISILRTIISSAT